MRCQRCGVNDLEMTSFADDDDHHDDKKEGLLLVVAVIRVMTWIMPLIMITMMMMKMMFAKNICPPFPPPRAEGAFGFLLDHLDPRSSCTVIQ